MEDREPEGARQAWQTSLDRRPSCWALRNLSVLAARGGRPDEAADLLARAWEIGPKDPSLASEVADALHGLQRYRDVLAFSDSLPEPVRQEERVTLAAARAALELGEYERLQPVFEREFATIREGEVTLSDLWFRMHERRLAEKEGREVDDEVRRRVRREFPPPLRIDYRMAAEKET